MSQSGAIAEFLTILNFPEFPVHRSPIHFARFCPQNSVDVRESFWAVLAWVDKYLPWLNAFCFHLFIDHLSDSERRAYLHFIYRVILFLFLCV